MPVFTVILDQPHEEAWCKLKSEYANWYILNDRTALIAPENPLTLSPEIAGTVGMSSDRAVSGMVVEVAHCHGHRDPGLQEWLDKVREMESSRASRSDQPEWDQKVDQVSLSRPLPEDIPVLEIQYARRSG